MYSLIGFPFIGGFYSKDVIIEFFFVKNYNLIEIVLFSLGIIFTFLYNFRLFFIIILKGTFTNNFLINKLDIFMKYPIFILTLFLLMTGNLIR
uniref:NADH dehydrogenase subunit 5 n=1 Tax=Rhipicephalus appendiculatus TaxID=34631 RepID=A0A131YVT0_RHIAP